MWFYHENNNIAGGFVVVFTNLKSSLKTGHVPLSGFGCVQTLLASRVWHTVSVLIFVHFPIHITVPL